MSSFLCFLCHSTVNADTNEDIREKYKEVVGIHLCMDSHLCYICCHVLNKLWLFRAVCLKRSLEYPVLFSEKGTLNLQRNDLEVTTICSEDICGQYHNRNINSKSYQITYEDTETMNSQEFESREDNRYVKLEKERKDFEEYFRQDEIPQNNGNMQDTTLEGYKVYNENPDDKNTHQDDYNIYNNDYGNVVDNPNDIYSNDNDNYQEAGYNNVENDNFETEHYDDDNFETFDENTDNDNNCDNNVDDNKDNVNFETFDQDTSNLVSNKDHTENIDNLEPTTEDVVKKKKSKKSKKKGFEKIVLSLKEQKMELSKRRKEKKYLDAQFKCYNCALGFLFKDTYQTHMMRHEESNGEYRCMTCTLRFASPAVLRSHAAGHGERHECSACGAVVTRRGRDTHAARCWGGDRRAPAPAPAACHLCAQMFRHSAGLQQHLKRYHKTNTSTRTYPCSVCGKTCANQAAVRTHMIKHINRKFPCSECSSSFSSPYTLAQHKKKHTVINTEQFYCEICNIGYSSRKSLLAHKRDALNHQKTLFECPVCARICPNERSLASHVSSVHSAARTHSCPHCGKRYTSRKSLVRHVGTHDRRPDKRENSAVCHLCGAGFKGNNKLNRHLREVCEKSKLEEEFATLYEQNCMNPG